MHEQDDIILIKEVIKGNTQMYSILVDRYQKQVFNFVINILKHREEAEETVQDTFMKAFKSLNGFRNEARFSSWLLSIAYNTSMTRLRKKSVVTVNMDATHRFSEREAPNNINRQIAATDANKVLSMAMTSLSEDEQAIVTLFYYNEQSIKEICDISGMTASNVKIVLHRSRKKMFQTLDKLGIKEWA